jgi:fructose/tagatose bisphosphate aldolase
MMRRPRAGYAIGYFGGWNLESLYGVVEAAEEARAPVIIGFNASS